MIRLSKPKHLATAALAFLLSTPALMTAQTRETVDVHSLGPQVGDQVPNFQLPDQQGQLRTLESVMGPNGAMLLFHRSADW